MGRGRAHADYLAGVYDQLDLSNLSAIEAIARRAELIEYQYRERAREGLRAAGLGTGASSSVMGGAVFGGEEADLFGGVGKIAGGAMVAPISWSLSPTSLRQRRRLTSGRRSSARRNLYIYKEREKEKEI